MKNIIVALLLSICTFNFAFAFDTDTDQSRKRKMKGCVTHIVNFGEDLPSILNRYELSINDLQEYNPLIKQGVKIGDLIYIPQKRIGSASKEQIKEEIKLLKGAAVADAQPPKETVQPIKQEVAKPETNSHIIEHTVKKGETFYSISRMYGVTVMSVHNSNPDVAQDDMTIGTILKINLSDRNKPVDNNQSPIGDTQSEWLSVVVAEEPVAERKVMKFDNVTNAIKVSLLLPLKSSGVASRQFEEFYNGFLVGLDSLKNEGVSVVLNVINTDKSTQIIDRVLSSGELDNSDIIIGPVYDEQFSQVAKYAADRAIPIVSPLAPVSYDNKYVFQVAPSEDEKYEKLRNVVRDKNVILFASANDDEEFVSKMKEFCGENFKTLTFAPKAKPDTYALSLESKRENIYLVAAKDQQNADAIISKIGAIRVFAGGKVVRTIASPRVARMSSLDPANLFSADVSYVTSYHVDRTNSAVIDFDRRYMKMFGGVPTLYGYRGYDVAMFFIGSMKEFGSDFYNYIADYYTTVLQVTYRFSHKNGNSMLTNREWMYVNYAPTYDIIVK